MFNVTFLLSLKPFFNKIHWIHFAVSYSTGSWRWDYNAWSLLLLCFFIFQIMDLKMFSIHARFLFVTTFHLIISLRPKLKANEAHKKFIHVLDNKFIWISGFELFVDHWRGLETLNYDAWPQKIPKNKNKKLLKFSLRSRISV